MYIAHMRTHAPSVPKVWISQASTPDTVEELDAAVLAVFAIECHNILSCLDT
jgi:hypothetical protein